MPDPRAWIPCAQFYAYSGQFDKVGVWMLPPIASKRVHQERECYRGAYQNAKSRAGWEKDDILCTDLVEAASNLTRGVCLYQSVRGLLMTDGFQPISAPEKSATWPVPCFCCAAHARRSSRLSRAATAARAAVSCSAISRLF